MLCIVLVVFAVRGVIGFVGGLFSGSPKTEKVEEQTVVEPVAQGKEVTIDLVMIGDILQHSGVFTSGYLNDGSRNYDHVFAHIGSELEGADIKVVNQETILGGTAFEFTGYPSFNGPQEMGDAEVKAGFNVVLRATNHALDYSYEGLQSELSYWKTSHPEVAVIGAQDPSDPSTSLDDVYVFEKDGFKVALLNYTYGTNDIPDPQGAVSTLDEEHVRSTLQKADELADMTVVFPHWGEEYCLEPIEDQYKMAQLMMDNGADVIIGGHPHVIEPVEILTASDGRKVPCFWSVGNFISTQVDDQNLIGGVAKVTMHKAPDGACSIEAASFVPTVTHKGIGADMTTYLLRDYNDDLASTNYLDSNYTDNTTLTVAWANSFCTQVLGQSFDTTNEQIAFGPEAFVAGAPQQTSATTEATSDTSSTGDATADATAEDEAEELPDAA